MHAYLYMYKFHGMWRLKHAILQNDKNRHVRKCASYNVDYDARI